jgi:hypothetical protein
MHKKREMYRKIASGLTFMKPGDGAAITRLMK